MVIEVRSADGSKSVEVLAPAHLLTPDQARRLAAKLLAAATKAEKE